LCGYLASHTQQNAKQSKMNTDKTKDTKPFNRSNNIAWCISFRIKCSTCPTDNKNYI